MKTAVVTLKSFYIAGVWDGYDIVPYLHSLMGVANHHFKVQFCCNKHKNDYHRILWNIRGNEPNFSRWGGGRGPENRSLLDSWREGLMDESSPSPSNYLLIMFIVYGSYFPSRK